MKYHLGYIIETLYSKRRYSSKEINKKYPNTYNGDFVINYVKGKVYKITKVNENDWMFYQILADYKEKKYEKEI